MTLTYHVRLASFACVVVLHIAQGFTDTNLYHKGDQIAPHIDQLAREGALFNFAYSHGPNCAPSRSSLLSGMDDPTASHLWELNANCEPTKTAVLSLLTPTQE